MQILIVDLWFLGNVLMLNWMLDGVCMKDRCVLDMLIFIIELKGHHGRALLHISGGDKASWQY